MQLLRAKIDNYKSYYEGNTVTFSAGYNVVVGRNNAGKTALLEAISLKTRSDPHRSPVTLPTATSRIRRDHSSVEVSFRIDSRELRDFLIEQNRTVFIPDAASRRATGSHPYQLLRESFANNGSIEIEARYINGGVDSACIDGMERIDRNVTYGADQVTLDENDDLPVDPARGSVSISGASAFPITLAEWLVQRIYLFKAERLNIGESGFGSTSILRPDASNLAEAINSLQSNPSRMNRFNLLVRSILPDVTQVTVRPENNNMLTVLVWGTEPSGERIDLAVPLAQCGTGIGQVLAMLYVAITSDYPQIIIIDEPQSFLHPGAIRSLLDVMKREARHDHQYIVTTHSPTVINAAQVTQLLHVRKEEYQSQVDVVDVSETEHLRLLLAEVGVRLGDVFGADRILWVEGPTEERCFPLVTMHLVKSPNMETEIVGVLQTGDLEGRHSDRVFQIYEKLSRGRALLPPAVAFVFDREDRTSKEMEDLNRRGKGRVRFLSRRMYENYLLNPRAIYKVIQADEAFSGQVENTVVEQKMLDWWEAHKWDSKYFGDLKSQDISDEFWLENVHGARFLYDLFSHLSDGRIGYEKVVHGYAITQELIERHPEDLEEVRVLLKELLLGGTADF